ncbi:hypothetical protein PBT90_13910 [Algoriphagus halophytocola]|uniref:hypothetical protein n=1 Tax=Algoriphagus halophytocola TaxID=2991499 RepID=UPI0022DD7431|nr:hypothetical protein [Algoriphagus sp. TR-M9]WBL41848.1 hypothetical protein PBT90_13910 [Algoriphagus sp. TR-M9]
MAIVLILTSLPFFQAQAQSGYIEENIWSSLDPGRGIASDFVIFPNGTKVFGQIQRNYDVTDYSEVVFVSQGNTQVFGPKDLYGFGIENGRFFLSKTLSEESGREFVQVIFSGKLQLDYKNGNYYIDNGIEIQKLRAFYQITPGAGTSKQRRIKLYISTLKVLTAGECGFQLIDLIEKSRLEEQDLIRILTQFHECEQLPYKLHVEKIPFVKFSPTVAFGVGADFLQSHSRSEKYKGAFSSILGYRVSAGIKLHDFRRSPKSSFEIRAGYVTRPVDFETSFSYSVNDITASAQFEEKSIVIPVSYSYSFLKRGGMDYYLGLVGGVWMSKLDNNKGFVDDAYNGGMEGVLIMESQLFSTTDLKIVPGIKLGASIPISHSFDLFAEVEAQYLRDFYTVSIPNLPQYYYNRTYVSFQIGLEL